MHQSICVFAATLLTVTVAPASAETGPAGDWRVDRIGGQPRLAGSNVTMRFDANGRVNGVASCNRFGAAFRIEGDKISFGPAMTTRMACPPEIMAQERRFLGLLETAANWRIARGRLIITSGDGGALEASAAKF